MNLTRRYFLQSSGALAAYLGIAPAEALAKSATLKQAAAAPTPVTQGKTLVVLFLRGGIDGLNLVVPHGDPHYTELRRNIGIAAPGQQEGCLDLDGFFGLHPRASALMPWYQSGHFVASHAVGYAENSRSHFEEQDVWETGCVGNTIGRDGWLNRHLLTSQGRGPVRAIALGDQLPRILRGDAPAYAVRGLEDLTLRDPRGTSHDAVASALEHAYCVDPRERADDARGLVSDAGRDTLNSMGMVQQVVQQPYEPAATYDDNGLANQLKSAARLIKANLGVEVIQVDYGGWDTHNNQGRGAQGQYGNRIEVLTRALASFCQDLGDQLNDTLVLTLSDFGRTAAENGTRGTDHGWANAMLAMGGPVAVKGGGSPRPVVTRWPGLAPDQLHGQRDLMHTTDFRDVLAEVVGNHLGNPNLANIIPDHACTEVGLI